VKEDGMSDEVEGKLKEAEGKLTGDSDREAEGKAQGALGHHQLLVVPAAEIEEGHEHGIQGSQTI
jgi:hypothetical protein